MEARLVPEHGFDIEWIGIEGVRGKGVKQLLEWRRGSCSRAARGRRDPASARPGRWGMGGFVSGPGGLMAAQLQRRPLLIQEQNSVPGMTNQWLRASRIGVRGLSRQLSPGAACHHQRQPGARRDRRAGGAGGALAGRVGPARLLVVGGSLGARR
jgi:UDP-N-acetylglucosamine--N-acetylmuramyl-(pentapeptide) pyrophosphoryl-undecaprenol N-acetylglucosamine transferase